MTVFFFRRTGRSLLAGCFVLLTMGASGCGSKCDLCGKVSHQGRPLALGSILLVGADGIPRSTWIEEDGSYHFADVPVGEAKLAVRNSPDPDKLDKLRKKTKSKRELSAKSPLLLRGADPELPAVDRTKWFPIPAEYSDIDRSGLRVTIHRGSNTYPIDMR